MAHISDWLWHDSSRGSVVCKEVCVCVYVCGLVRVCGCVLVFGVFEGMLCWECMLGRE